MDILVSLCNRDEDHPEALVAVDSITGTSLPVALAEPGLGAMGLCKTGEYVFVVVRLGREDDEGRELSGLYTLQRDTLAPVAHYEFETGRDVHSLYPLAGALYAVSTGTDELLRLELDDGEVVAESVYWRPASAGPRRDEHHLNAVYFWDGALVVSGFGRRPPEADWKDARDGFLWHLGRDERFGPALYQPHSFAALPDEDLVVCESPARIVRSLSGKVSPPLEAYVRGLCVEDGDVWAGLSLGRRQSKSAGTINNLAAPGAVVAGSCGLVRLDGQTFAVKDEVINLARYGREVYDLLALPRPFPGA
jgi:hypothetical protein